MFKILLLKVFFSRVGVSAHGQGLGTNDRANIKSSLVSLPFAVIDHIIVIDHSGHLRTRAGKTLEGGTNRQIGEKIRQLMNSFFACR